MFSMHRAIGAAIRALAAVALLLALVVPGSASASPVPVLELGGTASTTLVGAQASLAVPGRPPADPTPASDAAASSIRVGHSKAAGTRTNGKIFGVDPLEGGYSCSGTALNTSGRSIVLTAGHCVMEAGVPFQRISFVPAYNHGRRPFGTFETKAIYVMPPWRRSENPDFDVAALEVRPNENGFLTDVVGARGYATSKSRRSSFEIFGYPAGALRGEELRSCIAKGLGMDPLTNVFFGPPTVPAVCDMAAGSSGGGWLIRGEYLNGVTSYSYANRSSRLYSPYFGPAVAHFLAQLP